MLPWLVGAVTAIAHVLCTPGFDVPELAWVWLVPMALWALTRPAWKSWLTVSFFSMWAAKIAILIWLRHIYPPLGWVGLIFATAYFSLFPMAWLAFLRWIFPRTIGAPVSARIVIQLGLAGAWVLLEWVQGWLFTGCPWVLMADTQWLRPAVLSLCAWTGPWGLSFVILLFNIGLARYAGRFIHEQPKVLEAAPGPLGVFRQVCPEFYLGVTPIFFGIFLFYQTLLELRDTSTTLFTTAAVQTDFDPNAKWDPERFMQNADTLRDVTLAAAKLTKDNPVFDAKTAIPANGTSGKTPEVILWPEAALPFDVFAEQAFQNYLTEIATKTGATLLIGGISKREKANGEKGYDNGIYTVTSAGVSQEFYGKRHLVPFGEYIPFPFNALPIRKIVPVGDSSLIGQRHDPIPVPLPNDMGTLLAGPLVCYEDIFPDMSLDMARRGADFIVVVTNDAWYGREAGAYQHASHCAVIAASLRLPVVRCGNNGWSGTFNPLGQQHAVKNAAGTVYFRGAGRFDVVGIPAPLRTPTFYMTHGNWVITLSGLFTAWAYLRNRRWRKKSTASAA